MPIISVEAARLSKEQKERLVVELTKTASEIMGAAPQSFYVLIKENEIENWGVGGKPLAQFLADQKK